MGISITTTGFLACYNTPFTIGAQTFREILTPTQSTPADHESADRLTFDELLGITRLSNPNTAAPRPVFIVIDDVLNSGKHFKVAQSLLTTQFQNAEIRGLFFARCIRESTDFDLPPPPAA